MFVCCEYEDQEYRFCQNIKFRSKWVKARHCHKINSSCKPHHQFHTLDPLCESACHLGFRGFILRIRVFVASEFTRKRTQTYVKKKHPGHGSQHRHVFHFWWWSVCGASFCHFIVVFFAYLQFFSTKNRCNRQSRLQIETFELIKSKL